MAWFSMAPALAMQVRQGRGKVASIDPALEAREGMTPKEQGADGLHRVEAIKTLTTKARR